MHLVFTGHVRKAKHVYVEYSCILNLIHFLLFCVYTIKNVHWYQFRNQIISFLNLDVKNSLVI